MNDLDNRAIMAANIKRYMIQNMKTRKDVCDDLGFAYTTFCDWINGKKYPRIDKIELMAKYFNVSKSDLVEQPSTDSEPSKGDVIKEIYEALDPGRAERLMSYALDLLNASQAEQNRR